MRRFVALLFVVLALPSIVFGQAPARLEAIDPLSQPKPKLDSPLVLRSTPLRPEEKVVSLLGQRAAEADSSEPLAVIVTLHPPAAPFGAMAGATAEEEMVNRIAYLEHTFVETAREVGGFGAERGLRNFPIVFGTVPASRLMDLAAMPEVRAVEPVVELRATRSEGGSLVKAPQLRNQFGGTGSGVGVAVIDSGVDATHAELAGRVVAQGDFTGTTGDGTIDGTGHGTSVAGIIAGGSGGMAPQAGLWAAKIFDSNGNGTSVNLLAALDGLYESRNEFGGLHVMNLSISIGSSVFNSFAGCDAGPSPAITSTVNTIAQAGISMFVSSGNGAAKNGVSFPACLTNTVAVGAVYDGNIGSPSFNNCSDSPTGADKVTCYSNSGVPLDILAPSHCSRTPQPGGGYDSCFGGTSAAAPYAAGVAAQILSLRRNTTPAQMLEALATTGKPITDKNGITRRRIDAVAAYQALTGGGGGGGGGGGDTSPCVPDELTLCAVGGRFEITSTAPRSLFPGLAGRVSPVIDGDLGGAFHFFAAEKNFHTVVKVALRPSGFYAVSAVALDPLEWTVRIRDTMTGEVKSYTNPEGGLGVPTDTQAFAADP